MLAYNEITQKKYIELDGEPYEVIASHVFRKQQRKPVNQTKLRNLITGSVTERSFGASEKAHEAQLETQDIQYIYEHRGSYWFSLPQDPKTRFELPPTLLGNERRFLKEGLVIQSVRFKGEIIGVRFPIKVELKVTDAPPAVRGNTAQGGNKQVTLESGAVISAPLFINTGDTLRINTETGEYVERA